MVLKFGKRGVRSGVTLKSPSKKFLRAYRKYGYVIREDSHADREDFTNDKFGVDDVQKPNIEYSLNKKGRWLLAERLSNAIKSGQFELESYGVQLFEKHNLKSRPANCVSAYFSKGKSLSFSLHTTTGKRKKHRSGYMCAQSLKNTNYGMSKKNRNHLRARGKSSVTDDEDGGLSVPMITRDDISFEFVYPSPMSCPLTHTHKQPGYITEKPRQRSKYARLRRSNQDIALHDVHSFDDEFERLTEQYEVSDHLEDTRMRSEKLDLADFLQQAINGSNSGKKRKRSSDSFADYDVLHFDAYDNDTDNIQPIRVILDHGDTDPAVLARRYGDRYVECGCFPRKFIIDISDDVMALDVFSQHWKQNVKPVHACVVFVHDIENEINTTKEGVYKIYLNTSLSDDATQTRIKTLFDYTEITVDDCLNNALFFAESLPDLVQFDQQTVHDIKETHTRRYRIESLYGWKSQNYAPKDGCHFRSFMTSCQTNNAECSDQCAEGVISISFGQLCGICYEDIGFECSGTALKQCGHWFCDDCWEGHLALKVKSGSPSMQCPDSSCKAVVDHGTMLSLLSIRNIVKFAKFSHDGDVDRKEETKWCPNVRCGRVLVRTDPSVAIVPCDCGHKLCFDCLGPAHWPAPCQSVKRYQTVLRDAGFSEYTGDTSTVLVVYGRHCPGCKRFFEKIDGCPCMACICGKIFCWGCGRDWYVCKHSNRCTELGYQQVHVDLTCKFLISTSLQNEWFDIALEHRVNQQSTNTRRLNVDSKQIVKEITTFMNKTSNNILLEFNCSKRGGYTKESHKVPEFMQNLFDIHMELHFIGEHMAVALATDSANTHSDYYRAQLKKLKFYCRTIDECLTSHISQNSALHRLRKMKEMRAASLKLIKGIIAFTKDKKVLMTHSHTA